MLFVGAGARLERALRARAGHRLVRLGAQPVWDPSAWPEVVRHTASLRAQFNRARNKGVVVGLVAGVRLASMRLLQAWRARPRTARPDDPDPERWQHDAHD